MTTLIAIMFYCFFGNKMPNLRPKERLKIILNNLENSMLNFLNQKIGTVKYTYLICGEKYQLNSIFLSLKLPYKVAIKIPITIPNIPPDITSNG